MKKVFILLLLPLLICSCKKSLQDIISETEEATFTIYTYDEYGTPLGTGSGFFVNNTGTGITNYHVLDGAVKAIIKTNDETKYEIDKVIASDNDWDIAMFNIKNSEQRTFKFLRFTKNVIEKGDVVYNISSPLGLEHTVANGIVSSLRTYKKFGDIIQVTTPISQGSSGSALLNVKGEVFGVATFIYQGGQNLNFGTFISEEKVNDLMKRKGNVFEKKNPKFNSKDRFILINTSASNNNNITLNAIEFKRDVTIVYCSYTNLTMLEPEKAIYCEVGKKDKGFYIHDLERNQKYYIQSSSLGSEKGDGTTVPLASNHKFKVYFPPIKKFPKRIDIICDQSSKGWHFRDIDLVYHRNNITTSEDYMKEYAYSTMYESDFDTAVSIFEQILDTNEEDMQALNAMGIISFVIENNNDAEKYFSKVIDYHPNNTTGYVNRFLLRYKMGEKRRALEDITHAININKDEPDNYYYRAMVYYDLEEWDKAEKDYNRYKQMNK